MKLAGILWFSGSCRTGKSDKQKKIIHRINYGEEF
jgi:hypothetical protein